MICKLKPQQVNPSNIQVIASHRAVSTNNNENKLIMNFLQESQMSLNKTSDPTPPVVRQ
jgi:hypothetical protein